MALASFLLAFFVVLRGALAAPFPPPPPSSPWLYMGANETGPFDDPFFQSLAARGALAGYGWQNNAARSNFSRGEANVYGAVAALRTAYPQLPVFAYRNWHACWRLFDIQRAADDDASQRDMFYHNFDNAPGAAECRINMTAGEASVPHVGFQKHAGGRVVG